MVFIYRNNITQTLKVIKNKQNAILRKHKSTDITNFLDLRNSHAKHIVQLHDIRHFYRKHNILFIMPTTLINAIR